jgi:hypothetical protein
VGVWGSRSAASRLKDNIRIFLESLLLELSIPKTLITNARNERAIFLGTNIKKWVEASPRMIRSRPAAERRRSSGGGIKLTAPIKRIVEKLRKKGFLEVTERK